MPSPPESPPFLTHERELRAPVPEATPDGRLNPDAIGWSRHPLHTDNLSGRRLRKKRWDHWAVTSTECAITLTYADVDYLGIAAVEMYDFTTGAVIDKAAVVPLARGFAHPTTVEGGPIQYTARGYDVRFTPDDAGTRLQTRFAKNNITLDLDVFIERPPGHETLNVMIPWNDRTFQFTSKHNTRPARGALRVGNREYAFTAETNAFGVLDYGRGIWPYQTRWNWGAASGVDNGRTVGIQIGGKWTDGTGYTENGLCLDGVLHKIGEDLVWDNDLADLSRPWRITAPHTGRVDLEFTPFLKKKVGLMTPVLGSKLWFVYGHYSGQMTTDAGDRIAVTRVLGWAEEMHARW